MKRILVLSLAVILLSCGKPIPDLAPVDLALWKSDRGGCNNQRATFLETIIQQKDELKGLSEDKIITLLGRPDRNELYKRNQKFYYYDIEPGKNCDPNQPANQQIVIRFNAMSMAKEVSIEKR